VTDRWFRVTLNYETNKSRPAILDTSKFVRIAVDWLLRSDIGEEG
jgi:hypothetical protein